MQSHSIHAPVSTDGPDLILPIYKPLRMTSHDVVDAVRRVTGVRRVGHGGTLDPLARGVLVIGIGRTATRRLESVVQAEKEYIARIELGWTSRTHDAEGVKVVCLPGKVIDRQIIDNVLPQFRGDVQQLPPQFSALKVKGKPAYKYARKGKPVRLEARAVQIHELELVAYTWPLLTLRIVCSKGTYIRSLARDIGEVLQCGGYLRDLERTRVGAYTTAQSVKLDKLASHHAVHELHRQMGG